MKTSFIIRLDADLRKKLEELALRDKRSINSLIVKIVSDYSEEQKNANK